MAAPVKIDKSTEVGKKYLNISKTQQQNLIIVLISSLAIGVLLALGIYFVQCIRFNNDVISRMDESLVAYSTTIKNIGVCQAPKGEIYTDEELKACSPNSLDSSQLTGSLRYNAIADMAKNPSLESVARESDGKCKDSKGQKIDFQSLYTQETDPTRKAYYWQMLTTCSSLRVIPDALPGTADNLAVASSMNYLFWLSGWEFETLQAPEVDDTVGGGSEDGDDGGDSDDTGGDVTLGAMSVNFEFKGDPSVTMKALGNIERSIRTFDFTGASVKWTSGGSGGNELEFQAQANAYYAQGSGIVESDRTVKASSVL